MTARRLMRDGNRKSEIGNRSELQAERSPRESIPGYRFPVPGSRSGDLLPGVVAVGGIRVVGDQPLERGPSVGGGAGVFVNLSQGEEEGILGRRGGGRFDGSFQAVDRFGLLPLRREEARRVELRRSGNLRLCNARGSSEILGVGRLVPRAENKSGGPAR